MLPVGNTEVAACSAIGKTGVAVGSSAITKSITVAIEGCKLVALVLWIGVARNV